MRRRALDAMLSKKCALVTGSVAGLGYAIANSLAKAGAQIVLNDLCSPTEGQAAAERLAASTERSGTVLKARERRVTFEERRGRSIRFLRCPAM